MSSQPLTAVRRVATFRAFNPVSSPSLNFEQVGQLTKESDLITEISILKANLNSNEVETSPGQFILI